MFHIHAVIETFSAKAVNSWHESRFWWHSSGWAVRYERFRNEFLPNIGARAQQRGWDGQGAPSSSRLTPQEVETQQDREQRVARIEISPGAVEVRTGEQVIFIVIAFEHRGRIYLLHIYGKRERATLTASDKKKIKAVIDSLRREELL
jgi:hypothetical protein